MKNILNSAKGVVTSRVARQLLHTQKHSPHILFGVGVVGVVGAAVLASRASLKLEDTLADIQETKLLAVQTAKNSEVEYTDKDRQHDMVVLNIRGATRIAKLYAPAAAVGVISIALLTGSHVILTRRNVALAAAYATLEKAYREYRERVVKQYGADKDRELRFGSVNHKEKTKDDEGKTKEVTTKKFDPNLGHSEYARFFGEGNPNWNRFPEYNVMFLRAQQNYLNDRLKAKGHVFLNEAYDALGMDRSKAGAVVGWVWNGKGDNFIDLGVFDEHDDGRFYDFVTGREGVILLDFNVDGIIYNLI